MNVRELIAHLHTFDPEHEVEVVVHEGQYTNILTVGGVAFREGACRLDTVEM